MIRDKSLTLSSNGFPDTSCDKENDSVPTKTSDMVLGHKNKSVTIRSVGSNSDNISGHETSKTEKSSFLSNRKKYFIGKHRTQCNAHSNIKPNKNYIIPEILITKDETVNAEDD